MKVKLILISIILLLVMVFACGCIPFMEKLGLVSPTDEEQLTPQKASSDGLVKVLIGFKQKPGPPEQALVEGVGGKIKYTYHLIPAIAASVPEVSIEALRKNPNITHVELDGKVFAIGQTLPWGVDRIDAEVVHASGNKGLGVKVAIIDTGIYRYHEDLTVVGGESFVDYTADYSDDNGHGTHVAGIVAALDNGIGVIGVAPEAELYALKVLDESGSGYYSDVIAALQWCVDNSIQVTNNSYGSSGDPGETVKAAFDNASGVLHVAAAGNSGNPPGRGDNIIYPAAYESVIAVAATNQNDERARWSSTGLELELSAPGVDINSTLLSGGYGEGSGTSMASPHVAGTAALVIAAGIPDVRGQLQTTADDLGATGWDSKYGYGLVNAAKAAGVSVEEPPPVTGTMYVESITFSSKVAGPNKFLYTTVKVVDGDGIALEGVRVEMTLTHDSGSSWNFAGDTSADGTVKFTLNKAPIGHYTGTVTKLILTDYGWDTNQGVTDASCELKDDGTVSQNI